MIDINKKGELKGFEKYTSRIRKRTSPLGDLKIDEAWFFPEKNYKKIYARAYHHMHKRNKKFSFFAIKNGIVVRRDK